MSPSSAEARGLIGNAVTGYQLAWAHRRRLLAVLPPVLAPTLVGLLLLDLFLGPERMVLLNGGPTVHDDGGVLSWAKAGLAAASWLLALTAGTLTVTGAVRDRTVRPRSAILAACRRLPMLAVGLCAVAGAGFLAIWTVTGLAGAAGGPLGVAVVFAAVTAVALIAARMVVGVVSRQLGGSAWELTRGRVASTAGACLLGGLMVPLLLAYVRDQIRSAVSWPVLTVAIDAVLVTVVVAAQAGILAQVYLMRRDDTLPSTVQSADLDLVDARLAALAGGPPRSGRSGVAMLAVPVLLWAAVAVFNPYHAPSVLSHDDGPAGGATAVAWPAGQHPVIVTTTGARFCDNDLCDRYVARNGGPAVMDGRGTAGVGPDGTVVRAAVTGGEQNGGPFIHFARCTRMGCRQGWLPVRASAKEPFGRPELAAASAPDGAVWFVVATPSSDDRPGKATYRVSFIRCTDTDCRQPQRHQMGSLERTPDDGYAAERRARLSLGPDGRPLATFWIGWTLQQITCKPVTCSAPERSWVIAGPPDARWAAPAGLGEGAVSLRPGQLKIGDRWVPLEGTEVASQSGALAVTGSRVYATAAMSTTRPSGIHVSVGTPPEDWQQVLWSCEGLRCRRYPLDVIRRPPGPELLAVGADGRVLLVGDERITLTTLPTAG